MDTKRTILYAALVLVGLLLWSEWQKYTAPKEKVGATIVQTENKTIPSAPTLKEETKKSFFDKVSGSPKEEQVKQAARTEGRVFNVETDLLSLKIDKLGGDIIDAKLTKYSKNLNSKEPYALFNYDDLYFAESGISNLPEIEADGKPLFSTAGSQYKLQEGSQELVVELHWKSKEGISVEKEYHFKRGSYAIEVKTAITNQSTKKWQGQIYYNLVKKEPTTKGGGVFGGMSAYEGVAISDPDKKLYEKITNSTIKKQDLERTVTSGWVAIQEHYFLTSLIPETGTKNKFYTKVLGDNAYLIGYVTEHKTIDPQTTKIFNSKVYVGPEIAENLKPLARGLELTIDYGWLWFISAFLFQILKYINQYLGNWAVSIILLTMLIKGAFYYLSASSYRSMANMKKIQPKITALKEKYGDDKQKMSQAMFEMYRKEKINPLGGCLPMLIQIPFFIALYWVLFESVELRHAPFIFWLQDLSSKDPFYVLPIIMGLTMFLQQKMTPQSPDPTQAKVMMLMPVVFTFIFIQMPSGLVLYWVVNNILSILQQWYITRSYESKTAK